MLLSATVKASARAPELRENVGSRETSRAIIIHSRYRVGNCRR